MGLRSLLFSPRNARKNVVYAVVRCLSVTFVYCVETAKDTAIVVMECQQETGPKLFFE